jgi:archaellum component FlaG (FlaF/FlaG flagellin family)
MADWIGLIFIVFLIVAALVAVKVLANPRQRTSDEFERSAADNTTMTGALMNALHDVTDPAVAKAKEVRMQMKDGRYQKKKREGKAGGNADDSESPT